MAHYFDVISLLQAFRSWRQRTILTHETGYDAISRGIKQIHAEFSLLFGLHNAMALLSKLS